MNNINFGRVVLGGLLAGLVLNIGEYLLKEVIFVKRMEEMANRLNIARPGATFITSAVVLTFFLGIMLVWIYAMIRPRLGFGPKTAIVAGFIGWFCVYFYSGILTATLFGVSPNLLIIGLLWGLVEYVVAAIAGAALYKES